MMLTSVMWVLFTILLTVSAHKVNGTSFSCKGRETGFYADIETDCRVYHTCDDHGNKFTYQCPEETAFRQEALVCDHAYRVDCARSAKLIAHVDIKSDEAEGFSHSYRIAAKPSVLLLAPRIGNKDPTTFSMNSTVFLRDQPGSRRVKEPFRYFSASSTATTRPTSPFKLMESPRNLANPGAVKSLVSGKGFNQQKVINTSARIQNGNLSWLQTLTSMQSSTRPTFRPTTARTTTAGTEFPIPAALGALSGSNSFFDDPYYPRNPTSTEVYSLVTRNKLQHSTFRKPLINSVNLNIPDRLPDLNSLEDIVDRRKHLFISRFKAPEKF